MASIKVKFRPSTNPNQAGSIFYQIIHERKPKQLVTGYKLLPHEWNEQRASVLINYSSCRKPFLISIREHIRWDMERFSYIIQRFDKKGVSYTSSDIVQEFKRYTKEYSLFNYMARIIINLKQNGKERTAETYTATLNSFKKFRNQDDIMLDRITPEIMESYQSWHKQRGVTLNTISFYLRILRAVYNRAVESEVIVNRHPFRHVYTGIEKTIKRALPIEYIKKIKNVDLINRPSLDFARDMFLMSFLLRGMSLVDMAFLRKSDRVNGYIVYRRRKTGQLLTIKWTKEMQWILNKYPENQTAYLLPLIRKSNTNERVYYRNLGNQINRGLKKVANLIGLPSVLTLYVARHSWASAARTQGIPVSVISEGMGHESEATTRIYLASIDNTVIDRANTLIINRIFNSTKNQGKIR